MPLGERLRGLIRVGLLNPSSIDPTLVVDLPFSEGVGNIANDRSLYGNHGTLGRTFRKSHVINAAAGTGTNYQVKIVARKGSGTDSGQDVYLGANVRDDFGDVRFTASDGKTLLDYFMEEKVDGSYAVFWVEVAADLSSSNQIIYIIYGNSDATTLSNGANTFVLFDDFEVDLSQWTIQGTATLSTDFAFTGTKSVKLEAGVNTISKVVNYSNVAVHVRYRDRMTANNEKHMLICAGVTNAMVGADEDYSLTQYVYRRLDTYTVSNVNRTVGWHELVIRCRATLKEFLIDGILQANTIAENLISTLGVGSQWVNSNEVSYFDTLFVRKYVSPEPSHGNWGSEEAVYPSWVNGKVGTALRFDGLYNKLTIPNAASYGSIPIGNLEKGTIALWFKNNDAPPTSEKVFYQKPADGLLNALFTNPDGSLLNFRINTTPTGLTSLYSDDSVWADGQWHHIVGTYDGVTAKLYVDGVLHDSVTVNEPLNQTASRDFVLGDTGEATLSFDSDEFRVYNRALTASEIQILFRQEGGS